MSRIINNLNSASITRKLNTDLSTATQRGGNSVDDDNVTVVELNVGGVYYATTMATLLSEQDSLFAQLFCSDASSSKLKDSKNKLFFDRDGLLFRYVLDFLRNKSVLLPENFNEKRRLKREAEYFRLPTMAKQLEEPDYENSTFNLSFSNALQLRHSQQIEFEKERTSLSMSGGGVLPPITRSSGKRNSSGTIVIGYRGTFAFGREGLSDVKFRKISRILVCGRVQLCRDVFGDTLNESRDPDHGVTERYTSRFFLKHTFLEQAFDTLTDCGFFLVGTCATGTNSPFDQFNKAANDSEESRWLHYNEFVFFRT